MEMEKIYEEKVKCENCILKLDGILNEINELELEEERLNFEFNKYTSISVYLLKEKFKTLLLSILEVVAIIVTLNKFHVDINDFLNYIFKDAPYLYFIFGGALSVGNIWCYLKATEDKRDEINKMPSEKELAEKMISVDLSLKSKSKLKDYSTEQKAILVGKVYNLEACLNALNQEQINKLVPNKGAKVKGGISYV